MIHTVTGDIKKEQLGVTMAHEHFAVDLRVVRHDDYSVLEDMGQAERELLKARALGCRSAVEVTTNDMGRDVLALRRLSEKTGVQIICSTGFYLKEYHSEWVKTAPAQELCALFLREVKEGIGETGIRAGLIAEVATSEEKIYPSEEKVLVAAGMASAECGCAVSTHCQMGRLGHEQIELFLSQGMGADKVILGHTDLSHDAEYQKSLLARGVNLAIDTVGKLSYLSDEARADDLLKLLEAGYEDHLLLSEDVSRRSYLTEEGGRGYTAVLQYFLPMLRERGVDEETLDKLLCKNPARILDIRQGE